MLFTIGPAGDTAMRLSFQEPPSPPLTQRLLQLQRTAQADFLDTLSDSVVGYTTLTLFFTPLSLQRDQVTAWLEKTARSLCDSQQTHVEQDKAAVVLPVFYDPAVAPDLMTVADDLGMTIDALITLHSATPYFAYATGFAPGFCYLGTLDPLLKTQRLSTCPVPLFDLTATPVSTLAVGDSVRFEPIDEQTYCSLGGKL